jgi:hypothetical protein
MNDQWYYALNGRQLGPVSFVILQQFASNGQLSPTDLVWTAGMPKWAPAESVPDLLPSRPEGPPRLPESPFALSSPPRRYPPGPGLDEPRWGREPRSAPPGGLSSAGKAWLIVGCVAIAVVVGVALIGLVSLSGGLANPANPTTFQLGKGDMRTFHITFEGGKRAQIWVTSERNTDVDLFVLQAGTPLEEIEMNFVTKDDGMQKDCYVEWTPATTQTYQVIVWNRIHMPPAPHIEGPNRVTLRYSPQLSE